MSFKFLVQHPDNSFFAVARFPGQCYCGNILSTTPLRRLCSCGVYSGLELGNPASGWPTDTYINVSSDNFSLRKYFDTRSSKRLKKSFETGDECEIARRVCGTDLDRFPASPKLNFLNLASGRGKFKG